jgi:hypothetical protein
MRFNRRRSLPFSSRFQIYFLSVQGQSTPGTTSAIMNFTERDIGDGYYDFFPTLASSGIEVHAIDQRYMSLSNVLINLHLFHLASLVSVWHSSIVPFYSECSSSHFERLDFSRSVAKIMDIFQTKPILPPNIYYLPQ